MFDISLIINEILARLFNFDALSSVFNIKLVHEWFNNNSSQNQNILLLLGSIDLSFLNSQPVRVIACIVLLLLLELYLVLFYLQM